MHKTYFRLAPILILTTNRKIVKTNTSFLALKTLDTYEHDDFFVTVPIDNLTKVLTLFLAQFLLFIVICCGILYNRVVKIRVFSFLNLLLFLLLLFFSLSFLEFSTLLDYKLGNKIVTFG